MEKRYVKMNDNNKYLSLGNLFNIIKEYANNKMTAMQSEIFCSLFCINDINNTTVNNYCIGYRAIGIEYKKIYIDLKKKFKDDYNVFINIVLSILSILDEYVYVRSNNSLDIINKNDNLKKVCSKLISLSKEDISINSEFIEKVNNLYNDNNLYECFIEFLFYTILENKQPMYIQDIKVDINSEELIEYLKINMYEGISYISSLISLASKNNMYANAELGSLEFSGIVSGKKDYDKSFNYYMNAAKKNHPKACWMVANLILSKKIGNIEKDFDIIWEYLNKALKLGSAAALNTMGICYLKGINPENKVLEDKALEYFVKSSEYGYVYAYNNIGLFYESHKDFEKAFEYFKLSADMKESWALNKIGEIYRKNGNLEEAYFYYKEATKCPINEINYYSYYNLAKYYYLVGNEKMNLKKDLNKAKEYLEIAKNNGIKESEELLKNLTNLNC